jgi:hypothetical protein
MGGETNFTASELESVTAEQSKNRARHGNRFFQKWVKKEGWTTWQAAAVLLNIDPDKIRRNKDGSFDEGPVFDLVLTRLENAAAAGELRPATWL